MNKKLSIGLLLLVMAFAAVPGVLAAGHPSGMAPPASEANAKASCSGCHDLKTKCSSCHAYPFSTPAPTETSKPTAAPTETPKSIETPTETPKSIEAPGSPTILPTTVTLSVGSTQTFTAKDQVKDAMIVTWNSSNETVGMIDANGKFTALALGTTNITASNGTVNMTASVIVSETPVLTSMTLSAIISDVGTQSFAAKAIDQFNNIISSVVTWASSNPSVGTIDDNGKFTALAVGTTTITATNGTINGSALVIVMEPSTTLVKDGSKENKEHKEEKEHKEDKEHKDGMGDLEEDDED